MSARTQISMDPALQRRAQAKAAELGISFAEYVRRLVTEDIGGPKRRADISEIFDLGASGTPTNVARDKNKMLGDAAWEDYLRVTGPSSRRPHKPKRGKR